MPKYAGNNWSTFQIQMRENLKLDRWLARLLVIWERGCVTDGWCHGWSTRKYGRGETLKCRCFFSSVRGVNGFLVGLPIRRSIWSIAGKFLDRSKIVAWFYGWKCVVCFSREPKWLSTFYLFSFPRLPFLITRSITLETTQECTWSNRKRHYTSKYNNVVLWNLLLQNIHG